MVIFHNFGVFNKRLLSEAFKKRTEFLNNDVFVSHFKHIAILLEIISIFHKFIELNSK